MKSSGPSSRDRSSAESSALDLATIRNALRHRTPQSARPNDGEKRAAVAAILRETTRGAEVLLIRRAQREGDRWSGHMAFPGGSQEPSDPSLLATALRETREEIGLDLAVHGELIGRLDDIQAMARGRPAGMTVTPFVFALETTPPLRGNEEVDEITWGALGPAAHGEVDTTRRYELEGHVYDLPAYDFDGRIVWGLTHRMLQALLAAVESV